MILKVACTVASVLRRQITRDELMYYTLCSISAFILIFELFYFHIVSFKKLPFDPNRDGVEGVSGLRYARYMMSSRGRGHAYNVGIELIIPVVHSNGRTQCTPLR